MARARNIVLFAGIATYVMLWVGGIFSSVMWGEAPDGAGWAAPVFLYLASGLVLWNGSWRGRGLLLLVGAYGFAAEVIGESTGFPFGSYEYTGTLGPALLGTPLALFSAWIVVTAFVSGILLRTNVPRHWWVVAGPVLMVFVDLLLEPVATGPMDAWKWTATGGYYDVPLTNFLGWLGVSVPIFGLLAVFRPGDQRGMMAATSVIAFFLVLAVVHLLWGVWLAITGAAVVALILRRFTGVRMSYHSPPGSPPGIRSATRS